MGRSAIACEENFLELAWGVVAVSCKVGESQTIAKRYPIVFRIYCHIYIYKYIFIYSCVYVHIFFFWMGGGGVAGGLSRL